MKKHWYQVTCTYYTKGGVKRFDSTFLKGVFLQNEILDLRRVKKSAPPLHKTEMKHLLSNGVYKCKIDTYLGHFDSKEEFTFDATPEEKRSRLTYFFAGLAAFLGLLSIVLNLLL